MMIHFARTGPREAGSAEFAHEPPANPDLVIELAREGTARAAEQVIELLGAREVFRV